MITSKQYYNEHYSEDGYYWKSHGIHVYNTLVKYEKIESDRIKKVMHGNRTNGKKIKKRV